MVIKFSLLSVCLSGKNLPTAGSINAEGEGHPGLVVDVHTGRSTIKKLNLEKNRTDNASTRTLKSFRIEPDTHDQVSNNLSADEDGSLLANLDNVDKPETNKTSKDMNL